MAAAPGLACPELEADWSASGKIQKNRLVSTDSCAISAAGQSVVTGPTSSKCVPIVLQLFVVQAASDLEIGPAAARPPDRHADAFRLSRQIFGHHDLRNLGKRLLVSKCCLHGKLLP